VLKKMLQFLGGIKRLPTTRVGRSFVKNNDGAVAVEFAIVGVPFFMMVMAVFNTGLYFYAVNCVDRGIEDAARFVRTGEAQKGSSSAGGTGTSLTADQFRTMVCDTASAYIDCSQLNIRIQSNTDWSAINAIKCDVNNPTTGAIAKGDGTLLTAMAGTANSKVLITACYKWELGKYLPFVHFDALYPDGSTLIQSSAALQIEPYQ
jgi:Flp pilus assembly protein TadG